MARSLYLVEDIENNLLPVFCGDIEEIAQFFGTTPNTIFCCISRKTMTKGRYQIVRGWLKEGVDGELYELDRNSDESED